MAAHAAVVIGVLPGGPTNVKVMGRIADVVASYATLDFLFGLVIDAGLLSGVRRLYPDLVQM